MAGGIPAWLLAKRQSDETLKRDKEQRVETEKALAFSAGVKLMNIANSVVSLDRFSNDSRSQPPLSGKHYKQGASKTTRIGGTARAHESNPSLYMANLATIVGYTIKGTAPEGAQTLQLERVKAQGSIIGKRCGWSRNIGQR